MKADHIKALEFLLTDEQFEALDVDALPSHLKTLDDGAVKEAKTFAVTADVLARLGIGRTTLWEMEKREIIPKAIQLNQRCKRWRASDIDRFIAQREG